MKRHPNSDLFFGMDLRQLKRDWLIALRQISNWHILRWLTPAYITRIVMASGESVDYLEKTGRPLATQKKKKSVKFSGILLPDSLVLWHSLTLPKLSADEALSAIALEAKSLNPFTPGDLVWSHTALVATSGVSKVQIVIASRKIIAQHIASLEPASTNLTNHEVWVKIPEGPDCMVLDGFGEKIRRQRSARWRILNFCLVFLLLVTGFSAALTPTAQLYLRSIEAAKAYGQLRSTAAPAMQQRELLVKLDGQVTALRGQLARSIKPELVLLRITQVLNDDTYVTQIQTRDNKILLTGQTPNTAALMQQLGTQAGVTDVRAPTAAVKQRGSERETFNIEFTLDVSGLMPPQ